MTERMSTVVCCHESCGCKRLAYFLISLNYWLAGTVEGSEGAWAGEGGCVVVLSISLKLNVRWLVCVCGDRQAVYAKLQERT